MHAQHAMPSNDYICHVLMVQTFALQRNSLYLLDDPRSIAIILMGKRELIALLNLSSWCLVMFAWLFLAVPRGSLQFVIVVFPDHTHLLFLQAISGVLSKTRQR